MTLYSSDDLVKQLRMVTGFIRFETGGRIAASACLSEEAAARIEQLAATNDELEAKLAKAVTSLQHIAANKITDELTVIEWDTHDTFTVLDTCISKARTTLAELKGYSDD